MVNSIYNNYILKKNFDVINSLEPIHLKIENKKNTQLTLRLLGCFVEASYHGGSFFFFFLNKQNFSVANEFVL